MSSTSAVTSSSSSFVVVLQQVSDSPIISLTVCLLVAIFVGIFHGRVDIHEVSNNFFEVVTREQYWKVFAAPLCHASFTHLIINVITLWAIRDVEKIYGSFFFLRYTMVLIIAEAAVSFGGIALILSVTGSLNRTAYIRQHPLIRNINCYGFSSVLLAWLAFHSISGVTLPRPFFLLGILPIPWGLAPLMMIFIAPLYAPRFIGVTNGIGLLSGYLLGFGVLKVLPDVYWSLWFLFDVFLFLAYKAATTAGSGGVGGDAGDVLSSVVVGPSLAVRSQGNEDVLEMHADPNEHLARSNGASSSSSSGQQDGTASGEEDDIELGAQADEEGGPGVAEGYRDDYFSDSQRVPLTGLSVRHPSTDNIRHPPP